MWGGDQIRSGLPGPERAPFARAPHKPVHIGDSPVEKPVSGPVACIQAQRLAAELGASQGCKGGAVVRCAIVSFAGRIAVAAMLLLCALLSARAEILLQGDAAAVRIEVTQATVGEILAALRERYNVHHRTTIALDRPLTGTYAGPLPRVLARVLDGYDYVARFTADGVDIPYVRTRGNVEAAATGITVNKVILPMEVGQLLKVAR